MVQGFGGVEAVGGGALVGGAAWACWDGRGAGAEGGQDGEAGALEVEVLGGGDVEGEGGGGVGGGEDVVEKGAGFVMVRCLLEEGREFGAFGGDDAEALAVGAGEAVDEGLAVESGEVEGRAAEAGLADLLEFGFGLEEFLVAGFLGEGVGAAGGGAGGDGDLAVHPKARDGEVLPIALAAVLGVGEGLVGEAVGQGIVRIVGVGENGVEVGAVAAGSVAEDGAAADGGGEGAEAGGGGEFEGGIGGG